MATAPSSEAKRPLGSPHLWQRPSVAPRVLYTLGVEMLAARIVGRLIRRLLVGGVRLLTQHPISTLIIVVLLAIIYYLIASGPATVRRELNAEATTISPPAPSPAISGSERPAGPEQWLLGYRNSDATLVWSSMSDQMKQQAQEEGRTMESLQKDMDEAKRAGKSLIGSEYVGKYLVGDGRTIYFYVAFVRDSSSGQVGPVPFTFITDPDGKLLRVE